MAELTDRDRPRTAVLRTGTSIIRVHVVQSSSQYVEVELIDKTGQVRGRWKVEDEKSQGLGSSYSNLLPLGAADPSAGWALKAMLIQVDPDEALAAPPPIADSVSLPVPDVVDGDTALLDIFPMVVAKVVTKVVTAREGLVPPSAAAIVAAERHQVGGRFVHMGDVTG